MLHIQAGGQAHLRVKLLSSIFPVKIKFKQKKSQPISLGVSLIDELKLIIACKEFIIFSI